MAYHGKRKTTRYGGNFTRKDNRYRVPNYKGAMNWGHYDFSGWYPNPKIYSYWKKQCNKAVRRYKGEISDGCSYKKIEELKWLF